MLYAICCMPFQDIQISSPGLIAMNMSYGRHCWLKRTTLSSLSFSSVSRLTSNCCMILTTNINSMALANVSPGHDLLPTLNGNIDLTGGHNFPSSVRNLPGLKVSGSGYTFSSCVVLHRFPDTTVPKTIR